MNSAHPNAPIVATEHFARDHGLIAEGGPAKYLLKVSVPRSMTRRVVHVGGMALKAQGTEDSINGENFLGKLQAWNSGTLVYEVPVEGQRASLFPGQPLRQISIRPPSPCRSLKNIPPTTYWKGNAPIKQNDLVLSAKVGAGTLEYAFPAWHINMACDELRFTVEASTAVAGIQLLLACRSRV